MGLVNAECRKDILGAGLLVLVGVLEDTWEHGPSPGAATHPVLYLSVLKCGLQAGVSPFLGKISSWEPRIHTSCVLTEKAIQI